MKECPICQQELSPGDTVLLDHVVLHHPRLVRTFQNEYTCVCGESHEILEMIKHLKRPDLLDHWAEAILLGKSNMVGYVIGKFIDSQYILPHVMPKNP